MTPEQINRIRIAELKEVLRASKVLSIHPDYAPLDREEMEDIQYRIDKLEQQLANKTWGSDHE